MVTLADFYFRIDRDGTIVEYHGEPLSEEIAGKKFDVVFSQRYCDELRGAIDASSHSGSYTTFELRESANGHDLIFETTVLSLTSSDSLVLVRNITDRRNLEAAFHISKERFDLAVEAIHGTIYDWDIDQSLIIWTRGLCDVFGYELKSPETTDQWWIEHLHSDDRQRVLDRISDQLNQSNDFVVEYRFRDANDQYRIVMDRGRIVRDAEGRVTRVVGSLTDVTAERHASTERKRAEDSLHLLLEVISTASEAEDARSVTSLCLEVICKLGNWQLGQAWFVDEKEKNLLCSHSFYSSIDASDFRGESLRSRFSSGVGIPGKVWSDNAPQWIVDVQKEMAAGRAAIAKNVPLRSAFAFPIGDKDKLIAVFELFSTETRLPDPHILAAGEKLGSHLTLILQRKQEQERLRYQAYHDVLTGLPNRILLEDRFSQALAHARRNNLMLAILFLDLDEFKTINDRLGHQIGDHLLRAVAQRLSNCLREFDTLARLGGDEFMILLPDVENIQDTAKVAQKILISFETPFTVGDHELHTSTSIGISLYPYDGNDLQSLMKNADIALYRAKEKGRNNYQLYTPTMTVASMARMRMEKDLRHSIERNELLLHFQPEVDIQTGKIIAVEAFLRWHHAQMGLFLPAEFLPMAEETGLIHPIWEWALENACRQKKAWNDLGLDIARITMNIAAVPFQQNHLRPLIRDILKKTKLEPQELELEVTEQMTSNRERSIKVLNELRDFGVHLAMDDFGAGSSSLTHLKRFPMHTLKMDHYLVRGLATDPGEMAIAAAVISVGHGLGMTVIAEGVETKEQLLALRSIHCDGIQGFLICRPLPWEPITALLTQGLQLPF